MKNKILISVTFICSMTYALYSMDDKNQSKIVREKWTQWDQQNKRRSDDSSENTPLVDKKLKIEKQDQIVYQKNIQEQSINRVLQENKKPQLDSIVMLRTCDSDVALKVFYKLACLSAKVSDFIKESDIDQPIQLLNVSYEALQNFIIPALEVLYSIKHYYVNIKGHQATDHEIESKLLKFITLKQVEFDDCIEFIKVAHYLDIKPLFEALCDYLCELLRKQESLKLHNFLKNNKISKDIQEVIAHKFLRNFYMHSAELNRDLFGKHLPNLAICRAIFLNDNNLVATQSWTGTIRYWSIPHECLWKKVTDVNFDELIRTNVENVEKHSISIENNGNCVKVCVKNLQINELSQAASLLEQLSLFIRINQCVGWREKFSIVLGSEEERVWNELPEETKKLLTHKIELK